MEMARAVWRGEWMLNNVYRSEYWDLLGALPDASIDMVLADMPYGTTACKWDTVFDLAAVWRQVKRVIKPKRAVVFTASQPFTSALVMSNLGWFKYEWIWKKNRGSNFLNASWQPMREHENVLVFSEGRYVVYNVQMKERKESGWTRAKYDFYGSNGDATPQYGAFNFPPRRIGEKRCSSSVIEFDCEVGLHPTQKPVALMEYFIRTYTNEGDVVLDFCVGSGTTAIAARNTGRNFVVGDYDAHWVQVTKDRLAEPYTPDMFVSAKQWRGEKLSLVQEVLF